jgi:hypothetical protein
VLNEKGILERAGLAGIAEILARHVSAPDRLVAETRLALGIAR